MDSFFDPFLVRIWELEEEYDITFPIEDIDQVCSERVVHRALLMANTQSERLECLTDYAVIRKQFTHDGRSTSLDIAFFAVNNPHTLVWECTERCMSPIATTKDLITLFGNWDDFHLFSNQENKKRYL